MQLRLTHGALEAEQQPIIEMRGIIDPVFIANEGRGERRNFKQPMLIGIVSRKPRDLQAEHDPGMTIGEFGHQMLESIARLCART